MDWCTANGAACWFQYVHREQIDTIETFKSRTYKAHSRAIFCSLGPLSSLQQATNIPLFHYVIIVTNVMFFVFIYWHLSTKSFHSSLIFVSAAYQWRRYVNVSRCQQYSKNNES